MVRFLNPSLEERGNIFINALLINDVNRKEIVERAKELNVRLTNATAKLRKTTAE